MAKVQRSSERESEKSLVKTMLTAFFYAKGIIHHEFVWEKQTVNGKFYKAVIKMLIARVHHVGSTAECTWS
jgi:hypothetical protein